MSTLIEKYAMLGNCKTAALVSDEGSIDWLCFPRFDAPACFAGLLGDSENGRWKIYPRDKVIATSRRYRPGTMILETTFETETGRATVIDFMPKSSNRSSVARIVTGIEGEVVFDLELVIRFDYGSTVPWVETFGPFEAGAYTLTAVAGPDLLVMNLPVEPEAMDHRTAATFSVKTGDRLPFTLSHQSSSDAVDPAFNPEAALAATEYYWLEFSGRCPDVGPWTDIVKRSLITLKALTYLPTGGIVAAVTTSLPEKLGGERNWDYRYCWLRDATMTLLAFMNLGYYEEASAWREWLVRAIAGNPEQMQIMYGIGGERRLTEYELPWLKGYEGSTPVRVGNGAATQFQLDIYGEVNDALKQAIVGGLPRHRRSVAIAEVMTPFLEKAWRQPDEGLWEVRGDPRHFVHSKVMAWVSFDRLASMALTRENEQAVAAHYRRIANEIHAEVCTKGFDPALNSFVQFYGSKDLDASLLQIVLTGFLPPNDPRVIGTVNAIEKRLMRDGLLLRYLTDEDLDGLPPGEGTFLVCSFWLADAYALMGRYDDSLALFEHLLGLCNDVGLLAEQYDPPAKRMLGNFPQAFSHVGIINTAMRLHGMPCTSRHERDDENVAAT
jgi:GH15 family glucan-1,4-alpha-glucosidase